MFADGAGKDFGDASKDYGRAVLRLTGLPCIDENPVDPASHQLLHLGLNLSWLYSGSSTVRFRTRPEDTIMHEFGPHAVSSEAGAGQEGWRP